MNKNRFLIGKVSFLVLVANMLLFIGCVGKTDVKQNAKFVHTAGGNPYLPLWEHLPDGEPKVFEDPDNPGKYRAYIIGSHDLRYDSYCGPDIRIWSAPVEDLNQWRDEGAVFTYEIDGYWDVMYAPDLTEVVKKDGTKEYYLYPHSRGPHREAMVAKGNRPDGPFTPINLTDDGQRTLQGSILGFDPAVFIDYITDPNDPDYEIGFRAYGYWGFQRSLAAELDQNTMYSVRPGTKVIEYFMPASNRDGSIRDPKGTKYDHILSDDELYAFNFFEASSIRKIGNKYVMVFSGYSGPEYGIGNSNSTLRYAFADTPLGPWKSGGVLVDSRAPEVNFDGTKIIETNSAHNTHGSIEEINGQWYVFYHRPPRGFGYARQPMVAPVKISYNKKSVANGGSVEITGYDPYAKDEKWSAKAIDGTEYKGAEVTSEGFNIYGLDPYKYYSAGYASYFSNSQLLQDSWDIWDNHMTVANVKNSDIVGFKYFGFGGLKDAQKGLKPFEGTRKGNNTEFNIFIEPKTEKSFKINVWIDAPWSNETWNGKEIAQIVVPENSKKEVTKFKVDVSEFVENLDKKNAVYIVAESDNQEVLFDFVGLGFSSKNQEINYQKAPTISVKVNGKEVEVPTTPIRSTTENGIVGYDQYEIKIDDSYKNRNDFKVKASSDNKKVKVDVEQAASIDGEAVVKCDYNGIVKTYTVSFEN